MRRNKTREIHFEVVPRGNRGRYVVTARCDEELIENDEFAITSAKARRDFSKSVARRLDVNQEQVERQFLQQIEELLTAPPASPPADVTTVYFAVDPGEEAEDETAAAGVGMYRAGEIDYRLTDFVLRVDEDVEVLDDLTPARRFVGRIHTVDGEHPFAIDADDFANDAKLRAALYAAAGPKLGIYCRCDELRNAIGAISSPRRRTISTNFGWDAAETAYHCPSGTITADGFHAAADGDAMRVDLQEEERARHLDLSRLDAASIGRVKRHVVEDFLQLHDRRVMRCVLAAVALSVLYRFARGVGPPVLWLLGPTGVGKSFIAKLAQNFFGDFPVESGRFINWNCTANYIQRSGHFFRDALCLVDDYKPECTNHGEVVRILQAYADATARGRLNADATTKRSYEIRGILLSTGEDLPEHSSSALARSIVVRVPQIGKDLERGARCLQARDDYRGMTADFIAFLLREDRVQRFPARVEQLRAHFLQGIAGRPNDTRIAGNLALLGAAFEQIADYLADCRDAERQKRQFADDLLALREDMVRDVAEQQAAAVFLASLWDLVQHGHARIEGWRPPGARTAGRDNAPVVGRQLEIHETHGQTRNQPTIFEVSTGLALAEVQALLKRQGKAPLAVSERMLIEQLVQACVLLDQQNRPIDPRASGRRTRNVRVEGVPKKAFRIALEQLRGDPPAETTPAPEPPQVRAGNGRPRPRRRPAAAC